MFYSIYVFYVGFHNIDLGYNMNYVNQNNKLNIMDENNAGKIWTPREMYMHGLDQIQEALFLMCLSWVMIFVLQAVDYE